MAGILDSSAFAQQDSEVDTCSAESKVGVSGRQKTTTPVFHWHSRLEPNNVDVESDVCESERRHPEIYYSGEGGTQRLSTLLVGADVAFPSTVTGNTTKRDTPQNGTVAE